MEDNNPQCVADVGGEGRGRLKGTLLPLPLSTVRLQIAAVQEHECVDFVPIRPLALLSILSSMALTVSAACASMP